MAKTVSLLCASAPKGPAHYLARLPDARPLWSGADWARGALGPIDVDLDPVTAAHRKLYPWRIHTVVRFRGMAKPKREWSPVHALAEAVLDEVGGVMIASRVVLARLPSDVRALLRSEIDAALEAPAERLAEALEAAVKWQDPRTDDAIAAHLEEAIVHRGDPAPLEVLAQIAGDTPHTARWLGVRDDDITRLVRLLERSDEAGLPLGSLARERLRDARLTRWRMWAHATPPSRGDAAEIISLALSADARAEVILSAWCQRHVEGAERADLAAALTHASATRGPWPAAVREAVKQLIWKSEDDPLPRAASSLHEDDARWVASELLARAAERSRYEALVAGINARNRAKLGSF